MDEIQISLKSLEIYENELQKMRLNDKFSITFYQWLLKIDNVMKLLSREENISKSKGLNCLHQLLVNYLNFPTLTNTNIDLLCEIYCQILALKGDSSMITKLVENHINIIKKRNDIKPINFIILRKCCSIFGKSIVNTVTGLYAICVSNFKSYDVTIKFECIGLLESVTKLSQISISLTKDTFKLLSIENDVKMRIYITQMIINSLYYYDQSYLNDHEFFINICIKSFESSSYELRIQLAKLIAIIFNKKLTDKNQLARNTNFSILSVLELISPIGNRSKVNEVRLGICYTIVEILRLFDKKILMKNIFVLIQHFHSCLIYIAQQNLNLAENYIYIQIYCFILESLSKFLSDENDKLIFIRKICFLIMHEVKESDPCSIIIVVSLRIIAQLLPDLGVKMTNFLNCSQKKSGESIDNPLDVFISLLSFKEHEILLHAAWCIHIFCKYFPESIVTTTSQLVALKKCDEQISKFGVNYSISMSLLGSFINDVGIPSLKVTQIFNETINEIKMLLTKNKSIFPHLLSTVNAVCFSDRYTIYFIDDLIKLWTEIVVIDKFELSEQGNIWIEFKSSIRKCNIFLAPFCLLMKRKPKIINKQRMEILKNILNTCFSLLNAILPKIISTSFEEFNLHSSFVEFIVYLFEISSKLSFVEFPNYFSSLNLLGKYFICSNFSTSLISSISETYSDLIYLNRFGNQNHQEIESLIYFPLNFRMLDNDSFSLFSIEKARNFPNVNSSPIVRIIDSSLLYFSNLLHIFPISVITDIFVKLYDTLIFIKSTTHSEIALTNILCMFESNLQHISKTDINLPKYIRILPLFYKFFALSKANKKYATFCLISESIGLLFHLIPDENFKLFYDEIFSNCFKDTDVDNRAGNLLIIGSILKYSCHEPKFYNENQQLLSVVLSFTKNFNSEPIQLTSFYILSNFLQNSCNFVNENIKSILQLIVDALMKTSPFYHMTFYYITKCFEPILAFHINNIIESSSDTLITLKCLINACLQMENSFIKSSLFSCISKLVLNFNPTIFPFENINSLFPSILNAIQKTQNIELIETCAKLIEILTDSHEISALNVIFNNSISSQYKSKMKGATSISSYLFQLFLSLETAGKDTRVIKTILLKVVTKNVDIVSINDWVQKCYFIIFGAESSSVIDNTADSNLPAEDESKTSAHLVTATAPVVKAQIFPVSLKLEVVSILESVLKQYPPPKTSVLELNHIIEDTFKIASYCISSNNPELKIAGLKFLSNVLKKFIRVKDVVEKHLSILEQYQAILYSSLQISFSSDINNYKILFYAIDINMRWIIYNAASDASQVGRLLKLFTPFHDILKMNLNDYAILFDESSYAVLYLSFVKAFCKMYISDNLIFNQINGDILVFVFSSFLNCFDEFCYSLSTSCYLCQNNLKKFFIFLDSPPSNYHISLNEIISFIVFALTSLLFSEKSEITIDEKSIICNEIKIPLPSKEYILYDSVCQNLQSSENCYLTHYYIYFLITSVQQLTEILNPQNLKKYIRCLKIISILLQNSKFNFLLIKQDFILKETLMLLFHLQRNLNELNIHELILNIYLSIADCSGQTSDIPDQLLKSLLYETEFFLPGIFPQFAIDSTLKYVTFESSQLSLIIPLVLKIYVKLFQIFVIMSSHKQILLILNTFIIFLKMESKLNPISYFSELNNFIKTIVTVIFDNKENDSQLLLFLYDFVFEITEKGIKNEIKAQRTILIISFIVNLFATTHEVTSTESLDLIHLCEQSWSKLFYINEKSKLISCKVVIDLMQIDRIEKSSVNSCVKSVLKLVLEVFIQLSFDTMSFYKEEEMLFEKVWNALFSIIQISTEDSFMNLLSLLFPSMLKLISDQKGYYYKSCFKKISISYINKIGLEKKDFFLKFMSYHPQFKSILETNLSLKDEKLEGKAYSHPDLSAQPKSKIALKLDFSNFK